MPKVSMNHGGEKICILLVDWKLEGNNLKAGGWVNVTS